MGSEMCIRDRHFPGHGATDRDSHEGRSIGPALAELVKNDLVPFEAAIASKKSGIMVGHTEIPGVTEGLPSSLSPAAIEGLLRGELKFNGLVVTDSLNMRAVSDRWSTEEAVVMALKAGADLMILGTLADVGPAFASVDQALYEGHLAVDRLNDAAVNVLRAKGVNSCTLVGRVRGVMNTVHDW